MLNTYVVEGGVGKCTAFSALIPKLKEKSEVQIYTPYIGCFASNPDVKLVLEQTLPLQDARIMASDNIFYVSHINLIFNLVSNILLKATVNIMVLNMISQ
jgi:hypothetical protein